MIEGLSHLTFVVRDIARTARLFEQVLDAREVYASLPLRQRCLNGIITKAQRDVHITCLDFSTN